jgi:hypothetical protein
MTTGLPPFISFIGHGAASLAQPAVFTGATSYAFGFAASRTAMQELVDTLLNPVGGTQVHYDVPVGIAMASFMGIERCTSETDAIGWEPGRECALWVPLLETDHTRGTLRLVLWTPYIFIDYAIGMLTGREVWGWPKVWGRITLAGDAPGSPAAFGCATTLFDTLSPETQGRVAPLLTVTSSAPLPAPATSWASGRDAAKGLADALLPGLAAELADALLGELSLSTVQLKQFRDSLAPTLACYQAIVNSPAQPTGFTGGGLLDASAFELGITTCASHQIVRDLLGTAPSPGCTTVPLLFAAWLGFDFKALPGSVVVSTT